MSSVAQEPELNGGESGDLDGNSDEEEARTRCRHDECGYRDCGRSERIRGTDEEQRRPPLLAPRENSQEQRPSDSRDSGHLKDGRRNLEQLAERGGEDHGKNAGRAAVHGVQSEPAPRAEAAGHDATVPRREPDDIALSGPAAVTPRPAGWPIAAVS